MNINIIKKIFKSKKKQKTLRQYSKILVTTLTIISVIWITWSYILATMGMQFQPSFTDIASTALVNEIPSGVIPRSWKYVDNEFIKNEDVHPIEYNSERQAVLTNDTSNIVYLAMMANVTLQQS